MIEKDAIRELEKQWTVAYPYASLKLFHRKYKGVNTLYITTKGCYKVESSRLISYYFPSIYLTKTDYSTLTYTYRTDNEAQIDRLQEDSHDR